MSETDMNTPFGALRHVDAGLSQEAPQAFAQAVIDVAGL
jgi:hypothetical protein